MVSTPAVFFALACFWRKSEMLDGYREMNEEIAGQLGVSHIDVR